MTKFKVFHSQRDLTTCLMTIILSLVLSIFELFPAIAYASVETLSVSHPEDSIERPLRIKALNPGYSVDGVANVGEFIELANISDDSSLLLTGYSLRYTNSSGKSSSIFEFPEGSEMTGETILLRLASSPDAELSDLVYTKTLALEAGPLELLYQDELVDSVCWKGKDCLKKFDSSDSTSIVQDLPLGTYSHQSDYTPTFSGKYKNYSPPPVDETADNSDVSSDPQCRGLIFNELLSYYENDRSEQFIEFFNPTDETIILSGCQIRYKKKTYLLSGLLDPASFYVYTPSEFTLTKNPNTSNLLELIDVNGEVIDRLEYSHGQKKATSYALFGYDADGTPQWRITFNPTPGSDNLEQEYRSCPEGKVLNEATGNCVKASSIKAIAECPEGKYRNPETGRCKKIEVDEEKECKEGYERNPETGRCRKIKNNDGADYALVPETGGEKTIFTAGIAIVALITLTLGYVIFHLRHQILNKATQIWSKIKHRP